MLKMKKTKGYLLILFTALGLFDSFGQSDTILVYDVRTQTTDTILPISFDTTTIFNSTSSAIGSLGTPVTLNLIPPTTNLFSGSNFSDIERAELFYSVTDYPIRTAIKLFGWVNDTMYQGCSAIMIGGNLALTGAHCIMLNQNWQFDSMIAVPAYDNGIYQPTIPTSMVDKYYMFKTWYVGWSDDIAIIQLRQPIGQQIGWIGIAFSSDANYFTGKVFHKLSYPGVTNPWDSTKVYNGDTLYYNYGFIDNISANILGVNSPEALGIPGQSGSSLFYTDNSEYYSFGVLSLSSNYQHAQITRDIFYQFKNIMDNYAVATQEIAPNSTSVLIYPNPTNQHATVEFDNPRQENHTLTLYDIQGRLVYTVRDITTNKVEVYRKNLTSGLYFFQIRSDKELRGTGKLILE